MNENISEDIKKKLDVSFNNSNFLVYSSDLGVLTVFELDDSNTHIGTSLEEIFDSESLKKGNHAVIFLGRKTVFINVKTLLKIEIETIKTNATETKIICFIFQNQKVKVQFGSNNTSFITELLTRIKEIASDELKLMMELEGI